jgi:ABC-2 type transport system permease protein
MTGILWREWAQFRRSLGRGGMIRLLVVYGLLMGWVVPSGIGDPGASAIVFAVIPVYLAGPLAIDAFAGERERKTLETLLASPVSDGSLLAGKALFPVLASMCISGLSMCVFLAVSALSGHPLPQIQALLYALPLGAALTLAASAIGLHVSVAASSARTAQQWYSVTLVAFTVGLPLLGTEAARLLDPADISGFLSMFEGGWFSTGGLAVLFLTGLIATASSLLLRRRVVRIRILNGGRGFSSGIS